MARAIIIEGENLLQDLTDDWGGRNNTDEPIIPYEDRGGTTEVPAGKDWGMNLEEVERFVKDEMENLEPGDGSITTAKLADHAVTFDKMAEGAVNVSVTEDEYEAMTDEQKNDGHYYFIEEE